jgi:hypothetical protein
MQTQQYVDQVIEHLTKMLNDLPEPYRREAMVEVEALAYHNNLETEDPSLNKSSPEAFVQDLMTSRVLVRLLMKDEYRSAVHAESPEDMILRLLPSDGHLE